MKRTILLILACCLGLNIARAQEPVPYIPVEKMPDLVAILPAPPDTSSIAFTNDILRYMWGKTMRKDARRAALARRDAVWDYDTLATIFSEPFGMEISKEKTPEIHKLLLDGAETICQPRFIPKNHYRRIRPFVYFDDPLLYPEEDPLIRHEGSYPSGHTMRGWSAALILTCVNPDAATALFTRAWLYGESRVIAGAHWQSDVDASRSAASIGFAFLQACPAYQAQLEKARKEFRRLSKQ